jgi:hypothetical protein
MLLPSGIRRGSTATMPRRVRTPDPVTPSRQYAVADMDSHGAARGRRLFWAPSGLLDRSTTTRTAAVRDASDIKRLRAMSPPRLDLAEIAR